MDLELKQIHFYDYKKKSGYIVERKVNGKREPFVHLWDYKYYLGEVTEKPDRPEKPELLMEQSSFRKRPVTEAPLTPVERTVYRKQPFTNSNGAKPTKNPVVIE